MATTENPFASSTILIDGTVVARVTSVRRAVSMNEVDTTGAENVSGALADKQYLPVSIEETLELEGISMQNTTGPVEHEPGQLALITAAEAGTSAVLQALKPNGKGHNFTGYFTAFSEGGSVDDVYKWSGSFRVNSKAAV